MEWGLRSPFFFTMTGSVGQYKLAYNRPGSYEIIKSQMFDGYDEMIEEMEALKSEGHKVVAMELLDDDASQGSYEWQMLKIGDGKTALNAMKVFDPRFLILATLIIVGGYFVIKRGGSSFSFK